jgi:hypothetical protein
LAERSGNLPERKATSRTRRQQVNPKSWLLFCPATSQSKKLDAFCVGNQPDASATSKSKKLDAFPFGNLPIQKAGCFLLRQVAGAMS